MHKTSSEPFEKSTGRLPVFRDVLPLPPSLGVTTKIGEGEIKSINVKIIPNPLSLLLELLK